MSAIDITKKYPQIKEIEKRHKGKISQLKYKDKRRFSKLRKAIKNQNSKK